VHCGAGQALQVGRQARQVQVPAGGGRAEVRGDRGVTEVRGDRGISSSTPQPSSAFNEPALSSAPIAAMPTAASRPPEALCLPLLQLDVVQLGRLGSARQVQQHLAALLLRQPVRQLERQPEGAILQRDVQLPAASCELPASAAVACGERSCRSLRMCRSIATVGLTCMRRPWCAGPRAPAPACCKGWPAPALPSRATIWQLFPARCLI
jgi:hypothetical protein